MFHPQFWIAFTKCLLRCLLMYCFIKAHFTQEVEAKVQLKSSIPIGAKVEISSKGRAFTLGVKVEIEKNLFSY
jgi:hypothetical protein